MANAVEVADADALALQLLEGLNMRRRDPDIGVLIAPAGYDVKIGAAGALVKNRARLDIESNVHRLFFHCLGDAELLQAEGHPRIGEDLIAERTVGGLQPLVVKEIEFMGGHYRHLVQHVITGRSDSQFAIEHLVSLFRLILIKKKCDG
jgi:hypothetical protein